MYLHICSCTFVTALICCCTPFLSVYTYTLVHGLTEEFIYQWFTVPRSKWELQQTLIKLTSNMKKFKITLFKSLYCQEPSSGEIKEITHKEAHYCTPLCITSAQRHETLFSHSTEVLSCTCFGWMADKVFTGNWSKKFNKLKINQRWSFFGFNPIKLFLQLFTEYFPGFDVIGLIFFLMLNSTLFSAQYSQKNMDIMKGGKWHPLSIMLVSVCHWKWKSLSG